MRRAENKLTVLVIVNRLFEWSQNFITRELIELRRQGVDLYVGAREIIQRADLDTEAKSLLDKFIAIPENPFTPASLFRNLRFKVENPRLYFRAGGHFFKFKHPLNRRGRSLVCFFRAAAIAREVIDKKINLIHAHFLTAPGETALYLSKLTSIKFGGTGHAMDLYVDNSGLHKVLEDAAYIATCTSANADFLKKQPVQNQNKIHTVYHGIDIPTNNSETSGVSRPFTFLAAGRLVQKKGFEYLLHACHRLKGKKDFRCIIIGKGPLQKELKRQILALHLEDIVDLKDFVPPNQMQEFYKISDVLVIPSIIDKDGDRDGLPNVCLEAMTHGLAVIGSNISGISEGVIDNENGFTVPPADATELGKAMLKMMDNPDLGKMREASRKLVRARFDIRENVSQLRTIMENCL